MPLPGVECVFGAIDFYWWGWVGWGGLGAFGICDGRLLVGYLSIANTARSRTVDEHLSVWIMHPKARSSSGDSAVGRLSEDFRRR